MEKLDIRSIIIVAEEVYLSMKSAKQLVFQGLEVPCDRKLQGALVKADVLIKLLHLLDRQANSGDYSLKEKACSEEKCDDVATKTSTS